MGRPRSGAGRHSAAARGSWPHRLAAVPWLTLVLLGLVVMLAVTVLRPNVYTATAAVSATTGGAAARSAAALSSPELVTRVEQEIELDRGSAGGVSLRADRPAGRTEVLVTATAADPRLAALAADTAAALVVSERAGVLDLSRSAAVPTRPDGGRSPWWIGVAGAALVLALIVERLHERWELRHLAVRQAAGEGE